MQTAAMSRWNRLIAFLTAFDATVEAANFGIVEGRLAHLETLFVEWDARRGHIANQDREQ